MNIDSVVDLDTKRISCCGGAVRVIHLCVTFIGVVKWVSFAVDNEWSRAARDPASLRPAAAQRRRSDGHVARPRQN